MRKFIFATVAVAAFSFLAVTPNQAKASWLSEALHARFDPSYNGGYGPGYGYYNSYNPGYDYRYNPNVANYYGHNYSYVPPNGYGNGYAAPYPGYRNGYAAPYPGYGYANRPWRGRYYP